MPKTGWLVILLVFLVIVLGPVLFTQVQGNERRHLQGATLADLRYSEVSFRNEAQDIKLAGLLFAPDGDGPFPAVVIIHGAGTSQRDNPFYLTVVNYLQDHGVVVFLPDKRGSEKSEGNWRTSSFEDLATDTLAAVEFMRDQELVDISQIGILGSSQGGQLSPLVSIQSPDIAFLIDVVGTSLSLYDVLHYEEVQNLREMGFLPGVSDLIAYPSTFFLRKVTQKDFWDAVGNFDPLPYWQELTIPALVMYGSEDSNVPAEPSKARLETLNKENIIVNIYEGSGHPLEDPVGTGDSYFREDALADILEFIRAAAPPTIAFAQPAFVFQGDDPSAPVVTRNPSPEIENLYINPGAVLFHDNQFHMFFNSFTSWPGLVQVGYMTSGDGYNWQIAQDTPVFTTDQIPFGSGKADVSSIVVMEDGAWVMYFHTITGKEIGRASAPSPLGPWTVDSEPILQSNPHAWDSHGLVWPSIVKNGGELHMYYGAQTAEGYAIGLATSTDGARWIKYNDPETTEQEFLESDPVLVASEGWELNKVDRPRVVKTPDGWVMLYQGGAAVEKRGLAISNDGIHWKKYSANPIFTSEAFPLPNSKAWDTSLVYHAGAYYYFMELGTLSGTDIYLAVHQGALRDQ